MLDFELLYINTNEKGRMISTVAMPAVFLVPKSKEVIQILCLFLKEQRQQVSVCFLRPVSKTLSKFSCYLSGEPVRMLITFLHLLGE